MKRFSIILIIMFITLFRCNVFQPEEDDINSCTYTYTGYNQAGNKLITGSLRITYEKTADTKYPISIKGMWNFKKFGNNGDPSHLVGEGLLQGMVNAEGQIFINLHPGWMDNNVFLNGCFKDIKYGNFEGTWTYSTYAGVTDEGSFQAVRKITSPIW